MVQSGGLCGSLGKASKCQVFLSLDENERNNLGSKQIEKKQQRDVIFLVDETLCLHAEVTDQERELFEVKR